MYCIFKVHQHYAALYWFYNNTWPLFRYLSARDLQPASGTPITGKGIVICKYPSDPTVALGYLSVAFLTVSTVAGYYSLFYPYKGKSIPQAALFQNKGFLVFFNIAV